MFLNFVYNYFVMRVLLQVVKSASVEINQKEYSSINHGYLLLVGFNNEDKFLKLYTSEMLG